MAEPQCCSTRPLRTSDMPSLQGIPLPPALLLPAQGPSWLAAAPLPPPPPPPPPPLAWWPQQPGVPSATPTPALELPTEPIANTLCRWPPQAPLPPPPPPVALQQVPLQSQHQRNFGWTPLARPEPISHLGAPRPMALRSPQQLGGTANGALTARSGGPCQGSQPYDVQWPWHMPPPPPVWTSRSRGLRSAAASFCHASGSSGCGPPCQQIAGGDAGGCRYDGCFDQTKPTVPTCHSFGGSIHCSAHAALGVTGFPRGTGPYRTNGSSSSSNLSSNQGFSFGLSGGSSGGHSGPFGGRWRPLGTASHANQDHGLALGYHLPCAPPCDLQWEPRLPCGLFASQLSELLFRDITPEDYDLLLQLDESVKRPTASKSSVENLPEVSQEEFAGKTCTICLCCFDSSDRVLKLPCKHIFHKDCITKWLVESKPACPMCCAKVFNH